MILFDLDGVLVDSRAAIAGAINAALADGGLPTLPERDLHRFIGPPMQETLRHLSGRDDVGALLAAYRERYRATMASASAIPEGMPELLDGLAGERMVVATTKPRALAEPLLEALGLRGHFAAVEGPAMDAVDETKGQTIARALGHFPAGARPVMVGDREHDVIGARENGLDCIGVLWGTGSSQELVAAGAVAVAPTPADLGRLLSAR